MGKIFRHVKSKLIFALIATTSLTIPTNVLQAKAQSKPFMVGIVDGAYPCSSYDSGSWKGIAVDFWNQVSQITHIPYILVPEKNTSEMLEAAKQGSIDVGIGCISMSPTRLSKYSFTIPIKEDGVSVLTRVKSLDVGQAMAKAIFSPYLFGLVSTFFILMTILGLVLFNIEKRNGVAAKIKPEERRRYIFDSICTLIAAVGSTGYAITELGNSVLVVAFLSRLVFSSLLVSYITINVIKQNQDVSDQTIVNPNDLAGYTVSVRQGSVSEDLLVQTNELLKAHGQPLITIKPAATLSDAFDLIVNSKVDAMMGDTAQLKYLKRNSKIASNLSLGMQNTLIQSQGFTLSPTLPLKTRMDINFAMADLKQKGVIKEISKTWVGDDGADQVKGK